MLMTNNYIKNGKYDLQLPVITVISKQFGVCVAVVRIMSFCSCKYTSNIIKKLSNLNNHYDLMYDIICVVLLYL